MGSALKNLLKYMLKYISTLLRFNLQLDASLTHVKDKEAEATEENNSQVLPVADQTIHLPLTIFLTCKWS